MTEATLPLDRIIYETTGDCGCPLSVEIPFEKSVDTAVVAERLAAFRTGAIDWRTNQPTHADDCPGWTVR
jgi:hypothetical protein